MRTWDAHRACFPIQAAREGLAHRIDSAAKAMLRFNDQWFVSSLLQLVGRAESRQSRADNDHFFLLPPSFKVFCNPATYNVNIFFDGMFGLHDASDEKNEVDLSYPISNKFSITCSVYRMIFSRVILIST